MFLGSILEITALETLFMTGSELVLDGDFLSEGRSEFASHKKFDNSGQEF
jgi:hypothetical protein